MTEETTLKSKFSDFLKRNQNILFFLGILIIATFWRFYKINQIPSGLNVFEKSNIDYFIELSKNWTLNPKYIYMSVYSYLFASIGFLTNFNILFLRITQAILGVITVVLFYYFVKNWFNRQTAILAGLFLATSSFHVLISRNIEPLVLVPLIIILILYEFTLALRKNNKFYFLLAGIFTGFSFYVDVLFIFVPLIAIGTLVFFYIKNKKIITAYWKGFLISFISLVLVSLPYFYYLPQNINYYLGKFNPGSIGLFYLNLGGNLQALLYQAPLNNIINVGIEPLLDPFIAVSFVCGLIYAVFYLRRKKFLILSNWFMVGMLLISLFANQYLLNFILILPVVFVLSSVMLDYVLTHWVRTFPFNKSARFFMTILFSVFLFLAIFYNYQKYFWAFGNNSSIKQNYQEKIEYRK